MECVMKVQSGDRMLADFPAAGPAEYPDVPGAVSPPSRTIGVPFSRWSASIMTIRPLSSGRRAESTAPRRIAACSGCLAGVLRLETAR